MFGQLNNLTFDIEYSANFSKVSDPDIPYQKDYNDLKLGHNIFAKAGFGIAKHLNLTFGVGYLNTSKYELDYLNGQLDIERVESHHHYNYLILPVGLKWNIKSFFLSPEIGVGWNISSKSNITIKYTNGLVESNTNNDIADIYNINKITFPVILSFGKEIYFNDFTLLLGIKGYYSLSELDDNHDGSNHYLGFGVLGGIAF
jgi:hypothetical protein